MTTETDTPAFTKYLFTFAFHDGSTVDRIGSKEDATNVTNTIARSSADFVIVNFLAESAAPLLFARGSLLLVNIDPILED
jgi:hypothetical protein